MLAAEIDPIRVENLVQSLLFRTAFRMQTLAFDQKFEKSVKGQMMNPAVQETRNVDLEEVLRCSDLKFWNQEKILTQMLSSHLQCPDHTVDPVRSLLLGRKTSLHGVHGAQIQ